MVDCLGGLLNEKAPGYAEARLSLRVYLPEGLIESFLFQLHA